MGLDQHFVIETEDGFEEILYFRKFYELNEWVGFYLVEKYDINPDFNCEYIPVKPEDIKNLYLGLFSDIPSFDDGATFSFEEKWQKLFSNIKHLKTLSEEKKLYYYAWW